MNTITITQKPKHKQLSDEAIEYIVNSVSTFEAEHKGKRRNTGKTEFIRDLAAQVGTTVSNIYRILKQARVTVVNYQLQKVEEYSAQAACNRRRGNRKLPNNSKLEKAAPFIDLVVEIMNESRFNSIDETINYLILHEPELVEGMDTICTKTFYNYVHQRKVPIKPIDLPRMTSRKAKKNYKTYIPKNQKGTPISERPDEVETRKEFGHWEGDLVTGPRDGQNGALLTLVERKTRFLIMIPISGKTSKQVYMKINQLNRFYGDHFSEIFKSITFDNGSEFARYKDIEKKPGTKEQRTKVYFGRPYCACDRGSNENCNGLIRYVIKKGTDINKVDRNFIRMINDMINNKKRKILGYLPAELKFEEELAKIGVTENTIFYKD